jgi:hypothetical protein
MAEVDMGETIRTLSRRRMLGRGLLLVGAALGLGAAASARAAAAVPKTGSELRLYGRNLHLQAPQRRAGEVPVKGDRHTAYGQLLDRPNGSVVGQFTSAHFTQNSPFAAAGSSLEIHTFELDRGTIHGLGVVTRGADGHFVIVGGTQDYEGVHGSYVARQGPRELGGDGTAEFHLTLAE